ncbi:cell division cycle-associated protein 3 isoform X1 [Lethenteron reissneri]|uniref:cell division cycle-associated protein 3 isoform X1 n=1 Tax=Lethenteron reissneri TaxID=7753 RepID=UPI002AB75D5F|nr:cell division cycle-associated protein 3 isoform X1 [Lethenteron reissneri]XP_061424220.1 cell division cycle-associated protein 3 isoform X1 [Lethenteron reissneri]XP_061424221.1 cell division cycle-associated protein 3 isoform X1 [Lethenteron reissneri]XP_061424222.1 cell division cycle-associated protein 3 isoform X1 [Lethenteron reissneri]
MGLHESKDGAAAAVPETPIAMPAMRRLRQLEDPRSPSCDIERTPIEVGSNSEEKRRPERLSVGDTGEEEDYEEEEEVVAPKEEGHVAAVNDPRSPSQEFDRTPLRLEPEKHTQHATSALAMQLDLVFLGLNTSDLAPEHELQCTALLTLPHPESDTPREEADDRLEEVALRVSTAAPPMVPSMREQEPLDPPAAPQAPPPSPSEETPPVPAQCSPLCEAAINVLPELPIYCGSPLKAVSPSRPVLKQRVGPRVLGVHSSVTPRSPLALVTPRPPLYLVSLCDRNSPGKPQRPAVTGRKGGSGEALHVPARAGRKHERVMGGDKENSSVRALDD